MHATERDVPVACGEARTNEQEERSRSGDEPGDSKEEEEGRRVHVGLEGRGW